MNTYLVKMTPLNQYAFGTDMKLSFPTDTKTGKESYIVVSKVIPEQTTILGMLRYMILDHEGILKTDGRYTDEERAILKEAIGAESFQFTKTEQSFGKIQNLSPLFIVNNKNNQIYIKNPFHNVKSSGNTNGFVEMDKEEFYTSFGKVRLPLRNIEPCKSYVNLDISDEIQYIDEADLFRSHYEVGIKKNKGKNETDDDSFFKQQYIILKKGYSFGVYVECDDDLPEKSIQYMGQKKSAFLVETEVQENRLEELVKERFKYEKDRWFYALSDVYLEDYQESYGTFAVINRKSLRNLETEYTGNKMRTKRTSVQYNLIEAGSVFFEKLPFEIKEDNKYKIGYNHIVPIGGKANEV